MSGKKVYILPALLVLAGIFFLGLGIYNKRKYGELDRQYSKELLTRVRAEDDKILEGDESAPDQVADSLVRYSYQELPKTSHFVEKYLDHTNVKVRAAAVEASSAIEGSEFDSIVKKAIENSEEAIRIAAVKAMGRRPRDYTVQTLRTHLKREISTQEKHATMLALIRTLPEEESKNEVIEQLLAQLPTEKIARKNLLEEIRRIRPDHPGVYKAMLE